MKLEREAKQSSEMVDRRENEASSNQMKADGREIDRTSGPFRAGFQKKSCQSNQFTKNLPFQKCLNPKLKVIINLAWVALLRIERKGESVVRIRIPTTPSKL